MLQTTLEKMREDRGKRTVRKRREVNAQSLFTNTYSGVLAKVSNVPNCGKMV